MDRFLTTSDGALLGEDFVKIFKDKYPWKVGGTYTLKELGGVSITFVGVFKSTNRIYNSTIIAGRRFLQEGDDMLGKVHQVYVKVDNATGTEAVIQAIDREVPTRFPYATSTTDQRAYLTGAVRDLMDMVKFARIILFITLAVILVAVANTISMATRDRIQEIGMLRSLGFRRGHILMMVLGESTLLSLLGGVVGLAAITVLLLVLQPAYGVRTITLEFQVPPLVIGAALVLSLAVGFLGGILPAIGASRVHIVTALGRVD